jgi:hypothetical protein
MLTTSPPGVHPLRMRAGIRQAVTVRRSPTEMAALLADLRRHRRRGAEPVAQDFPLRLMPQQKQQRLMLRLCQVHRAACLGQPHRYPERGQHGDHHRGVTTGERPLDVVNRHAKEPEGVRLEQTFDQAERRGGSARGMTGLSSLTG